MRRSSRAVVAALLACLVAADEGRAELACATPVLDVGEVRAGAPLAHTFPFVNRGPDPVEVVEVRPGCDCLTPRLGRRSYAPEQEGYLTLEVNTLTKAEGPEVWRCTLVYQDGGQKRELTLALCGRVRCEIGVEPAALNISTHSAVSHQIVLTDSRPRPFTVTGASTTSPHLRAQVAAPRADASGHRAWDVRLDVLAGLPEGRHEEWVRLTTNDPLYPELKVPVTVEKRRRAAVTAAPPEVEWTAAGDAPLPARVVLLRGGDDREVVVEKAECDHPGVRCSWARGPGVLATLKLTVDRAQLTTGARRASVRVHLVSPAAQTITIPVTWTIR